MGAKMDIKAVPLFSTVNRVLVAAAIEPAVAAQRCSNVSGLGAPVRPKITSAVPGTIHLISVQSDDKSVSAPLFPNWIETLSGKTISPV